MKIKVLCEAEYDTEDVLNDLRNDYPDESWSVEQARDIIHQWIKDDMGPTMMSYRIEETNG